MGDEITKLLVAIDQNKEVVYDLPIGNVLKEACRIEVRQELLDFLISQDVLYMCPDGKLVFNMPIVHRPSIKRCTVGGACGGPYFEQSDGTLLCRVHNHARRLLTLYGKE